LDKARVFVFGFSGAFHLAFHRNVTAAHRESHHHHRQRAVALLALHPAALFRNDIGILCIGIKISALYFCS
jgi:hypothetical protein